MEIKRFDVISCLFFFLFAGSVFGQQDVKTQINEIKRNEFYIKAEANSEDETEAAEIATKELFDLINAERVKNGLDSVSLDQVKTDLHHLSYKRGSIKRVFVYMEYVDSTVVSSQKDSVIPDIELAQDTLLPVVDNPIGAFNNLVMLLCDLEMADEAVKLLLKSKKDSVITELGQLQSMDSIDTGNYLVVYDRQRSIRAILRKTETSFYNIKRDCADELRNYSGCGSLWFR